MTINLDWSDGGAQGEGPLFFQPGGYLVEIMSCEYRTSSKGDPMFKVRLGAVHYGKKHIAYDYFVLGGKGKYMGLDKLKAFGVEAGTKQIDSADMPGRQAYANIVSREYEGKPKLEVGLEKTPFHGYWKANDTGKVRNLQLPGPNDNVPDRIEYTDPFSIPPEDSGLPF